MLETHIRDFMADEAISERVKIECYLLVALGIRKAGLIMVPAEIPGLEGVGPEIDNEFYWRTEGRRDPEKPVVEFLSTKLRDTLRRFGKKSVRYKIELLREIFDRVVLTTPQYHAHLNWAKTLDLSYKEEEVRPSIREIWIYRDRETGFEIDRLARLRRDLRQEAMRKPRASASPYFLMFPEESSAEFVKGLGELLGYPPSCLARYIADRASPGGSVEMRAAHQISEMRLLGKSAPPEAYFVKDFFPCAPDCPEACAKGKLALESLEALDERVAEKYREILAGNRDMVEKYPEIIEAHAQSLKERIALHRKEPGTPGPDSQ